MDESSFYLTLPSNTEKDQKTSNFIVNLNETFNLKEAWEFSLSQIIYPHNFETLISEDVEKNDDGSRVEMTEKTNDMLIVFSWGKTVQITVPPGHYSKINELIKGIRYGLKQESLIQKKISLNKKMNGEQYETEHIDVLLDIDKYVKFTFDKYINRVKLRCVKNIISQVHMGSQIGYMLGFNTLSHFDYDWSKSKAEFPPDMKGGIVSLYVYCSLASMQRVGNIRAPLLKIVHLRGNYGEIIEESFSMREYINLQTNIFNSLSINVCTDTGRIIEFPYGKIIIKLHFRKKKDSSRYF